MNVRSKSLEHLSCFSKTGLPKINYDSIVEQCWKNSWLFSFIDVAGDFLMLNIVDVPISSLQPTLSRTALGFTS